MIGRRGFLGAILALTAAPAIVQADSLMKIIPINQLILWGDDIHDDAAALQALMDGKPVKRRDGSNFRRSPDGSIYLSGGTFALGAPIILPGKNYHITNCHLRGIGKHEHLLSFTALDLQNIAVTNNYFQF